MSQLGRSIDRMEKRQEQRLDKLTQEFNTCFTDMHHLRDGLFKLTGLISIISHGGRMPKDYKREETLKRFFRLVGIIQKIFYSLEEDSKSPEQLVQTQSIEFIQALGTDMKKALQDKDQDLSTTVEGLMTQWVEHAKATMEGNGQETPEELAAERETFRAIRHLFLYPLQQYALVLFAGRCHREVDMIDSWETKRAASPFQGVAGLIEMRKRGGQHKHPFAPPAVD